MSTSVGSIHYDLGLDTKDFDKQTGKLDGKFKGLSKKFAIAGAATATAFGAAFGKFVIGGGISRYLNIEDAQAKLKGLGHDAKSVSKIMESALDSVKGTAYGLDAAATIAASAVAAGVESGKELTDYLGLTADAATIAGTSLSEMGSIFNKVQTGQRAYTQELNQLADRGIPIYQWLQEELGLSQEALKEMVSAGELDSATYFKVIEKNIGGAALESGKTTRGAWENAKAAMSRVGAAIVKDIMPKVRKGFLDLTAFFDRNSEKIVNVSTLIIDIAGKLIKTFISLKDVIMITTAAFVAFRASLMLSGLLKTTTAALAAMKAVMSNPFAVAVAGIATAYTLLNAVLNKNANDQIKQNEAMAEASEVAAEYYATIYKEARAAYGAAADAADSYTSSLKALKNAQGDVEVKQKELSEVLKKYGKNSAEYLNKNAELLEAEAKLAAIEAEREGKLKGLNDEIIKMTESTGALGRTTYKQIDATLASLRATEAAMTANGENTDEINRMIQAVESLRELKDTDVKVGAVTSEAQGKINEIHNKFLQLPKEHIFGLSVAQQKGSSIADVANSIAAIPRTVSVSVTGSWRAFQPTANWGGVPYKMRASGGQVTKGQTYMVNERGPEMFVPNANGTVLNADKTKNMSSNAVSIFGNINIGNKSDADYFFRRLNLDQDRLGSGLSALETSGV